jgi:hypothetical protein
VSKNIKIEIYRIIILHLVLYGCGTWSLTLREERKLRLFENRVLRRIFGSKSDETTGEWGKLHIEKLNDLFCSPNIVRVIKTRRKRWAGKEARKGERRGAYRGSVGKPEGMGPLGRSRRR